MSNIFYPKRHRFYRTGDLDTDVSLRPIYGDLYGTTLSTANINTTVDPEYLLASTTLPQHPQYGGGQLGGAALKYYVNAVSGSHTAILPRLKVYKAQDNITLTSGSFPPILTTNISAFSSYLNYENPWITEGFDGTNKGMGDREEYTKIYWKSYYSSRYEISGLDWYDYLEHMNFFSAGKRCLGRSPTRWKNQLEGMTFTLTQQGTKSDYGDGKYVIKDLDFGNWGKHDMFEGTVYITNDLDVWIKYGAVQKEELGGFTSTTYNNYDHDFVGRITQFNSLFNYVHESTDVEDIKVQSVGSAGDDNVMYTESAFTINAEEKLTGASAGQMRNFYENLSGTTDVAPSYSKIFGMTESDTASGGTAYSQTVMGSLDYLPMPYVLDVGASGAIADGVGTSHTGPSTAQEIEFKLKFDDMSPILYANPATNWHFHRGFFIVFCEEPPLATDTFHSYLLRMDSTRGDSLTATGVMIYRSVGDSDVFPKLFAVPFLDKAGSNIPIAFNAADTHLPFSAFNSNLEFNDFMEIPYGSWFTLRFKMDVRGRKILCYTPDTFDEKGAMNHMELDCGNYPNSYGKVLSLNSMSVWLNNFRAINVTEAADIGPTGLNPNMFKDADGFRNSDMSNSVIIDSINFRNYNNDISNATVCKENPIPADLAIPSAPICVPTYSGSFSSIVSGTLPGGGELAYTMSGNASVADNYYGSESTLTHSNLCFGFEERPKTMPVTFGHPDGFNLFLNNFNVPDGTLVTPISGGSASGSVNANLLKASYSRRYMSGIYSLDYGVDIGGTATNPLIDTVAQSGWVNVSGGVGSVDGFTQKGSVYVSGANMYDAWDKTENVYVAARVLAANGDGTDIMVDRPEIFDLPRGAAAQGGTDYIMWRPDSLVYSDGANIGNPVGIDFQDDAKWALGSGNVGVVKSLHQRQARNGNLIHLNRATNVDDRMVPHTDSWVDLGIIPVTMASYFPKGYNINGDGGWKNKARLGSIFISPKKYWLNMHIVCASGQNWGDWYRPRVNDGDNQGFFNYKNERLKGRFYGPAIAVSGGGRGFDSVAGTFGSSNNESLYTDGLNARAWHTYINGEGIFEVNTDYGHGVYEEGTEEKPATIYGGYINESAPISGSYDYMDLDSYVTTDSPQFESKFNFCLIPFLEDYDANRPYFVNVDTLKGTKPPQLIWGFDVPLGKVSDFKASSAIKEITNDTVDRLLQPQSTNIEFTWQEELENVWYRLLFVDTDLIQDKYHKANAIIPFNENPGVDSKYYFYSSSAEYASRTNSVGGTGGIPSTYSNIQGFQGYGFSGSALVQFGSDSKTLGSASEFTMLAHLKPSTTGTIMRASGSVLGIPTDYFTLRLDSSKKLVATMNSSGATLTSTTTYDVDSIQPLAVAITYNKNLDNNNFKMYVNNSLEDTTDYTSNFGNTNLSLLFCRDAGGDLYTGFIEDVSWHTKAAYFPQNSGKYSLGTKNLPDLTGNSSNKYQSRLFVMDYHNIRGTSPKDVVRSDMAAWKVTGV